MTTKNEREPVEQPMPAHAKPASRWEFDNLLDAEAQGEVREFYRAIEKSKDCNTVLVGYTPPRD
jgi:hypothetical protein